MMSTGSHPAWLDASLELLRGSQNADGGWAYFAGGESAIEPTATAIAALHAMDVDRDARRRGLDFLASMQVKGGALKPQSSQADATSLSAMAGLVHLRCSGGASLATQIADTLVAFPARTLARDPSFANDSTLRGLPWTANTYSWVEPTAYGVMLFDALGRTDAARTIESRTLLLDRAVPTGGWNYGNPAVFNTTLEADPLTTAFVILALLDDPARKQITDAAAFLRSQVDRLPSPLTLAWAAVALRSLGNDTSVDPARFGPLLTNGILAARSPWHHAAAALAVAPLDRNPFVRSHA